jgi:hypothetical protein
VSVAPEMLASLALSTVPTTRTHNAAVVSLIPPRP